MSIRSARRAAEFIRVTTRFLPAEPARLPFQDEPFDVTCTLRLVVNNERTRKAAPKAHDVRTQIYMQPVGMIAHSLLGQWMGPR